MRSIARLLALLVLLAGAEGRAGDVERPFRGVTIERRELLEPRPLRIALVRVDLTAPDLTVETSPPGEDGVYLTRRPSVAAREEGYALCVNAAMFRPVSFIPGQRVEVDGPLIHAGRLLAPARDRRPALCIDDDGRASIRSAPLVGARHAVAGFEGEACLRDGIVRAASGGLHPRTVVGASHDGTTLFLLIVDGRQRGVSEGCTIREAATWLREAGAWSAINLDGGGSTTLVVAGEDGTPRVENVPVGWILPGTERPVATCIGIRARRLSEPAEADPASAGPGTTSVAVLVIAAVAVVAVVTLAAVLLLRRRLA